MSTEVKPAVSPPETGTGLVPYRLSVKQFLKMIDAGVFPDDARVELIRGRLVTRMTKNDPHNFAVDTLVRLLRALVEPGLFVREEKSVVLGAKSRPEPDVAVVRGPRESYRSRGPEMGDLALVAEVSDSSYRKDRSPMWSLYAEAGVPVYWIVNLPKKRIEVFSRPSGAARSAGYGDTENFEAGSEVPVVIDGIEVGKIAVNDVLP